jgi:hypothetical protein
MLFEPIGLPVVGLCGAVFRIDWRGWGGAKIGEERRGPGELSPSLEVGSWDSHI